MVKKNSKKKSVKKVSKKSVKKSSKKVSQVKSKPVKKVRKKSRVGFYGLNFTRIVLIILAMFGIYHAWVYDWVQGVSLIALSVFIYLIIELIREIRR